MTSAPSMLDAIVSISFRSKPEKDKQTQITAEVSQYFTLRKCQFVIQQDVRADVGWSLALLVRIPPGQPKLQSIRRAIDNTLRSERLGRFTDLSVQIAQCDATQSHALDLGLCQDQSVDAIQCATTGPAASACQTVRSGQSQLESKLGQNTNSQDRKSGCMRPAHWQEKSGDY